MDSNPSRNLVQLLIKKGGAAKRLGGLPTKILEQRKKKRRKRKKEKKEVGLLSLVWRQDKADFNNDSLWIRLEYRGNFYTSSLSFIHANYCSFCKLATLFLSTFSSRNLHV